MSSAATDLRIEQLKDLLGDKLCTPEQVKAHEGLATGNEDLDRYLLWHGLPKGALSMLSGAIGTGATTLWIEAAARAVAAGRWVAWINNEIPLSPLPLAQKGVNLGRFVSVQPRHSSHGPARAFSKLKLADDKERATELFFILQELMSSTIFELIGCDLGHYELKEHQLRKLQAQARDANVALVFVSQNSNVARLTPSRRRALFYRGSAASVFSLIVNFEKRRLVVERALHRRSPHTIARSFTYARFTNFSGSRDSIGNRRKIEHARR